MKFRGNSTGNIKPPEVLFPYYSFQNSLQAAVTVFVLPKLSYLLFLVLSEDCKPLPLTLSPSSHFLRRDSCTHHLGISTTQLSILS